MKDKQLALTWFASRPDEWDAVHPYVRHYELEACGKVIRDGIWYGSGPGDVTWITEDERIVEYNVDRGGSLTIKVNFT